jgi:hypothetical protein
MESISNALTRSPGYKKKMEMARTEAAGMLSASVKATEEVKQRGEAIVGLLTSLQGLEATVNTATKRACGFDTVLPEAMLASSIRAYEVDKGIAVVERAEILLVFLIEEVAILKETVASLPSTTLFSGIGEVEQLSASARLDRKFKEATLLAPYLANCAIDDGPNKPPPPTRRFHEVSVTEGPASSLAVVSRSGARTAQDILRGR